MNDYFSGKATVAVNRRRDLLLEISKYERPILYEELKYRLPDRMLKQYQGSVKMLSRDMNYLCQAGLVRMFENGYVAAKDKMKAFLPLSVQH